MKKIICILGIALIIVACGERDEEYFFAHQEKAKEQVKACEEQLMDALENSSMQQAEAISKDNECIAAKSAISKQ